MLYTSGERKDPWTCWQRCFVLLFFPIVVLAISLLSLSIWREAKFDIRRPDAGYTTNACFDSD